jgi:anoctamin-7
MINSSLEGYTEFSLAYAPTGSYDFECRYRGYRDREGNLTYFYWQLLAFRLVFVILFEHLVFLFCKLIDLVIPDIPEKLEIKIKREQYLAKKALQDMS